MPAWVSSARVRRVSSAAITSASRNTSTARGDRSPRLPIGVATSTRRARRPCRAAHVRSSTRSPARSRQRSNAPASASITNAARRTNGETRHGARRRRAQHDALRVAERDVDREAHADGVHVAARAEHAARRRTPSRPEQPAPRARRGVGHLDRGQHLTVADEPDIQRAPSHVEADLEHVAVDDLVVLPLDPQLALLLRLRPRADVEQLVARRSPRPG